jgi:hypothetical protein
MNLRSITISAVAFLSSLLMVSSCSDNTTSVEQQPPNNTYPQSIGNRWVYDVVDSVPPNSVQRYEMIVNVIDTLTLTGNRHLFLWTYTNSFSFPETADTQYVQVSGDSVVIYDERSESSVFQKYYFPFTVGKEWAGPLDGDTTRIVSLKAVTLPIQTFFNTYQLRRTIVNGLESATDITIYYVPSIGIIALNGWDMVGGVKTYHTWTVLTLRVTT